ncbi:hypothetical protein H012_gp576 [Acanthamoeba polyphaga moumouvirus]|uniref:Uncharacterized protein n=2 Tax=Moumouvirus TaxID=3080801 RepID=L7RC85_9VIRU|nr:hypothetical protein H012_gp576 [Acanthamoeba polyphaga moumouvirus]AEX62881.1 hypothetical protein mv_L676 [Moumouvirus Monve]AGC01887.1 hypothetical protein Moumou_00347 [Acanthamoeba polyphaga moumouvirus]AQN68246.1 hypothetical protein [Saudi moumouvirus]
MNQEELKFYEYIEKQRENYTDLTQQSNDSVIFLAKHIFTKPLNKLDEDLTGILLDDSMDIQDLFCMLVELVLHGLNILTKGNNTVFHLNNEDDSIIDIIKKYISSLGFKLYLLKKLENDINIVRDNPDYYCEILPKPPKYLCFPGWYVLNYRILATINQNNIQNLENLKAIFKTNNNEIYEFYFKYEPKKLI